MNCNLKKCPKCGSDIANIATECPICNYNFLRPQITSQSIAKGKSKIGGSYYENAGVLNDIIINFSYDVKQILDFVV